MRVAILLSGGVDSMVAAYLLQKQGFDLLALTMINWDENIVNKSQAAAQWLGIEQQIVDLRADFKNSVIDYFCRSYAKAETPNPCVFCNKAIKFGKLLDIARQAGCEKVATGHYARITINSLTHEYQLLKGQDVKKDQSYFLYRLDQEQLAQVIFPLGDMQKSEVKAIAKSEKMPVAESPESQEICFVEDNYQDFLRGRIEYSPGTVYDMKGIKLGDHKGLPFYTIGQRKGLGISLGEPAYVVAMNKENNSLILGNNRDLYKSRLLTRENHFISRKPFTLPVEIETKIRYGAAPAASVLSLMEDKNYLAVDFKEPQRAVTPGQAAVFYQGDIVLGGGIINN